jgi:hypothetical protein
MNRRLFTKLLGIIPLGIFSSVASTHNTSTIKSSQKFLRGHRVKIIRDKSYIDRNIEAIVIGSYRELCNSKYPCLRHVYEVMWLQPTGVWQQTVKWYNEDELVMINSDRDAGEQLYQSYLDKLFPNK